MGFPLNSARLENGFSFIESNMMQMKKKNLFRYILTDC